MLYFQVLTVKYGSRIKLLYTDTDSLMVCLETNDLNKDLEKMQRL